jgi:hypothetical protein
MFNTTARAPRLAARTWLISILWEKSTPTGGAKFAYEAPYPIPGSFRASARMSAFAHCGHGPRTAVDRKRRD